MRTITLADGSTVTLSGAGEASIALSDSQRRVELTSGYALFDALSILCLRALGLKRVVKAIAA